MGVSFGEGWIRRAVVVFFSKTVIMKFDRDHSVMFSNNVQFRSMSKPFVIVVKGQLTDWIIVNTTYKSDIQKVKT